MGSDLLVVQTVEGGVGGEALSDGDRVFESPPEAGLLHRDDPDTGSAG
jgi:hypothetical protein